MVIIAGERIKKLRESKGYSQAKLARILNITRSSVNAWEMGISIPSTQKIIELAILFKTSTDYILGLSDRQVIAIDNLTKEEIDLIYKVLGYIESTKKEE